MCGIAGAIWTAAGVPLDDATLRVMTDRLAHRGPDAAGSYRDQLPTGGIALGHRRLSIIDLSTGGQPLANEDESVWITFNGEIYNYKELAAQLVQQGHRFHTQSDTETIVHLYEQEGRAGLTKLRGMFAFAIWDRPRQKLILVRDRFGKKPLLYHHTAERLLFASELKSLLAVPGLPREIDPLAVADYIALQYVPHPRTILRGFQKLPPGCWAEFDLRTGQLTVERYWVDPYPGLATEVAGRPTDLQPVASDPSELRRQLREQLTEAVALRLRSDVPVGAFLSGGMDSTIITGLMQQLSTRPVQTFSIGFPVPRFDERSFARAAAQLLRTEHHELVVDPQALELLPELIWQYDEPFADSSAIPSMYLARWTRQHVTVALTGDGGDELFCGYDRYRAVQLAQRFDRLPAALRWCCAHPLWQRLPSSIQQRSPTRRLKRFLQMLGQSPTRRYLNWISIFDDDRRSLLFTADFRQQLGKHDPGAFIEAAYARCPGGDFVERTTFVDVETYLPCDILNKVDLASMAYGLECRSPFLDHRVAELAARIPLSLKRNGPQGKQILLDTFGDLLPDSIKTRAKMGFGVPLDHWFRHELQPLLRDVLLSSHSLQRGWFEPRVINQLVEEHTRGQFDHSSRLWSLLVFELWQQRFIEDRPLAGLSGTK